MFCHVQAGPSNSADKEQEGYRSYVLQRLLPAMLLDYDIAIDYASVRVMLAMAPHRMELVAQRLEKCTTVQLEEHLEHYDNRLLMVRAVSCGAQRMGRSKEKVFFPGLAKCAPHCLKTRFICAR